MKRSLPVSLCMLLLSILVITSCNTTGGSDKESADTTKTGSVEVGTFDILKVKDQIVQIVQTAPDYNEIAIFLNKTGTSYIYDLGLPVDQVDRFMTTEKQSLAMGVYAFDLGYARAYNRVDNYSRILQAEQTLATRLGAIDEYRSQKDIFARLKANLNNKDSLDKITAESINRSAKQMSESAHPEVYALSFAASNIEGLYITTQLALMSKNNKPLIEFLSKQKERAEVVYSLLELLSGMESVKPIFEKMQPVMTYFTQGKDFTVDDLKEIEKLIKPVREEILL